MARMRFGAEKRRSRFPYWVIPTVVFVFGVGMLAGRAMESDLTLAEFRDKKVTVSDVVERLWPKRGESLNPLTPEAVAQQTRLENRLKRENARLLADKDALVHQLQTLKSELRSREASIESLRSEINKIAQANQELLELSEEHEKFKQAVALEREVKQGRETSRKAVTVASATTEPPAEPESKVAAKTNTERGIVQPPERSRGPSYQVLRRTPILRNPSDNAQILSYLNPGRRVNVGGIVNGRFVRVQYSRSGNPPGYVLVSDVMPLE